MVEACGCLPEGLLDWRSSTLVCTHVSHVQNEGSTPCRQNMGTLICSVQTKTYLATDKLLFCLSIPFELHTTTFNSKQSLQVQGLDTEGHQRLPPDSTWLQQVQILSNHRQHSTWRILEMESKLFPSLSLRRKVHTLETHSTTIVSTSPILHSLASKSMTQATLLGFLLCLSVCLSPSCTLVQIPTSSA